MAPCLGLPWIGFVSCSEKGGYIGFLFFSLLFFVTGALRFRPELSSVSANKSREQSIKCVMRLSTGLNR